MLARRVVGQEISQYLDIKNSWTQAHKKAQSSAHLLP